MCIVSSLLPLFKFVRAECVNMLNISNVKDNAQFRPYISHRYFRYYCIIEQYIAIVI